MKIRLLKKGIVLAIIILFVGVSVIPSIYGSNLESKNLRNSNENLEILESKQESILEVNSYFSSVSSDLAVANLGDDDVSILINNGSGEFPDRQDYPTGNGSVSVVTGDFNKDRYLDLAIANNYADDVTILLNNGSGGFTLDQDYTVGDGPYGIVTGDFNKDKYIDLATANYYSDDISILMNDGSGGFIAHQDFSVGNEPWGIATGDYDNDSDLDLAITNTGDDDMSVLLNNGTGGFSDRLDFSTGDGPYGIAAGDFDSDYDIDLAVTNTFDMDIIVLENDGSGGFGTSQGFPVGNTPVGIVAGIYNSDSDIDLAVTNAGDNDMSVLLNDGSGRFFNRQDYSTGSTPWGITAGDFNSDDDIDLAVTNAGDNDISVFQNNGIGGFGTSQDYSVGNSPYGIAAGDFEEMIENIIPIVNIVYPNEGETISGTINISGTADDTDGFVELVEIKIDDDEWINATGETDWTYELDTTQYSDGDHTIYARSYDGENYSNEDMVNVILDNIEYPPDKPIIQGPTNGIINSLYSYNFTSTDPDGDDIAEYIINWGDGTGNEVLKGPFASGEPATGVHFWTRRGTYVITAKARDVNDMESEEGFLTVTIPKAKGMQMSLILRFFQKYPNIFQSLRHLLGI
jgi:predicted nucleotidyltransferase